MIRKELVINGKSFGEQTLFVSVSPEYPPIIEAFAIEIDYQLLNKQQREEIKTLSENNEVLVQAGDINQEMVFYKINEKIAMLNYGHIYLYATSISEETEELLNQYIEEQRQNLLNQNLNKRRKL